MFFGRTLGSEQPDRNCQGDHRPAAGGIKIHRISQPNEHQGEKNHGTIRTVLHRYPDQLVGGRRHETLR